MADVVERLVTEWDADFSKMNEKLDKVIRAVYGAADKMGKGFKEANDRITKEMVSLQHKLEVAQAGSNKVAIEGLRAQILLLQTKSKLMRLGIAETEAQAKAEAHVAAIQAAQRAGQKSRFVGAVDSVIDSTRLKVLDSGVARVGLFGSALEGLGAAGLAGAAGIAVLAAALAKAKETMDFADELSDSAAKAQTTTTALQELRYAILAVGGEEKDADAALQGLSSSLGAAQKGYTKAVAAFGKLGISKEQLRSYHSAEEILPVIADKISKLGSEAEKAALADKLGVRSILPLLEKGALGLSNLRAEAHRLGVVLDEDLVRKAGEAHDKAEILSKVIDLQLKSAVADLAPVIVSALQEVADLAKGFNDFTKDVKDSIPAVERIGEQVAAIAKLGTITLGFHFEGLDDPKYLRLLKLLNPAELMKFEGKVALQGLAIEGRAAARAKDMEGLPGRLKSALAGRKIDTSGYGEAFVPKGPDVPEEPDGGKAAKLAEAQRRRYAEEAARLEGQHLQELLTDGRSLEDIAVFHQVLLDLEEQSYNEKLKQQVADKEITQAQADRLKVAHDRVIGDKRSNATFEDKRKADEEILRQTVATLNAQADIAEAMAGLAKTLDERRALEAMALAARQKAERDQLQQSLANNPNLTPAQRDAKMAALLQRQGLQAESLRRSFRGPLQAYAEDLGSDSATQHQAMVVDGLSRFGDALTDAVFEAKDFGDALREIGRDLAKQLFREAVDGLILKPAAGLLSGAFGFGQKAVEGAAAAATMAAGIESGAVAGGLTLYDAVVAGCATGAAALASAVAGSNAFSGGSGGLFGFGLDLFSALPAFASGTNFAPGGLSLVGERGPELVNLPRGAQVIPNHVLDNLANMGVPKLGGGQTINVRLSMDLTGVNGDETLRRVAADAADKAFRQAVAVTNAGAPGRQARFNLLGS